jgi:oligopeptidase A
MSLSMQVGLIHQVLSTVFYYILSYQGHVDATAENGPWIITLDTPSFTSVMQHAKNRGLREEIYRAHVTRASSGDLNNSAIIDEILKLRLEKAKLLNYNNYAEV